LNCTFIGTLWLVKNKTIFRYATDSFLKSESQILRKR
jgi:hypothetical protein